MEIGRKERGQTDRDGDRRREGRQTGMELGRKERHREGRQTGMEIGGKADRDDR